MTDARTTWIQKLRHTPLRDVVRGRVTGRLDVESRIRAADLPKPAADLVRRVVKRTRLWKLERADVAAELAAHFADGLAAGESAESLIESFGDERAASKLIRRAKRRNRPLAWKLLRVAGWAVAAFLLYYGLLFARFYLGRPVVSVDYVVKLNDPIKAVAAGDRAWPVYRAALLGLGKPMADGWVTLEAVSNLWELKPGDPKWPEAVGWLDEHRAEVALVRRAAAKPAMGFVLGKGGSADDPAVFGKLQFDFAYTGVPECLSTRYSMSILLPHLNGLRELSMMLETDARAAQQAGDAGRFVADVGAMLGLADQLANRPFVIEMTTAVGVRADALDLIDAALRDKPAGATGADAQHLAAPLARRVSASTRPASGAAKWHARSPFLTDAQLRDLAHSLAGPEVAADLFSLRPERLVFEDSVQRLYTDGGPGGGHMTADGVKVLGLLLGMAGPGVGDDDWIDAVDDAAPAAAVRPLLVLAQPISRTQAAAERHLGRRDGTLVGLALELHRRHGSYPATLDELTPGLLPSVPIDRITGGPVRYRLTNGRPVVYSVGADRDDDGGRAAVARGKPEDWAAAVWGVAPAGAADGDWVLYP